MKRKNNKKIKLLSLFFIVLFVFIYQTIVYSAINSTMKITGDAYARAEADVRITGFRLNRTLNATSSYEEFGKNHITTEIGLLNPSSSITYYVEITNYGTEDVGIFDITGLPSVVNYSIKDYNLQDKICDDTGKCNNFAKKTLLITLTTSDSFAGNVQLNFDFRTYHKVTYTDIENKSYPLEVIDGGNLNVTFKDDLKRVQVLSNNSEITFYKQVSNGQTITINNVFNDVEVKIKPQVAKMVKGNIDEVGGEVCIDEECFYIISNDGSTVSMIAKYNLYVGNEVISANHFGGEIVPLSNPTGMQSDIALGYYSVTGEYYDLPWYGTVEFSNDEIHGESYTDYSGSLIEYYVNNYKYLLEVKGVKINNARLLYFNEFSNLGCELYDNFYYKCENSYDWISSTSYWLANKYSEDLVYCLERGYGFVAYDYYHSNLRYGVRPVIELDIDEIRPLLRIKSGDLDTVGSELCISDECFYVISSDDTNVTMITKYNLSAGHIFTGEEDEDFDYIFNSIDNPTGMQDKNMIGATANKIYPYNGVLSYGKFTSPTSIPAYIYDSQSKLYPYIENYKNILNNTGIHVNEARLINNEELRTFGCNIRNNIAYEQCYGIPSWMISTTYWTGVASRQSAIACISTSGQWENTNPDDEYNYGIRPVIEMPKWNFANKIEFIINNTAYTAKEGMTWGEWIESKYNISSTGQTVINSSNGIVYEGTKQYFPLHKKDDYTNSCKESDIIDPTIEYSTDYIQDAG